MFIYTTLALNLYVALLQHTYKQKEKTINSKLDPTPDRNSEPRMSESASDSKKDRWLLDITW